MRKWYSINPLWYKPKNCLQNVIFGEETDKDNTLSCIAINWFPTGPKLDADFDEWDLLSRNKEIIDLLAQAAQTHGRNLTVSHVCDVLKQCGFVENKS